MRVPPPSRSLVPVVLLLFLAPVSSGAVAQQAPSERAGAPSPPPQAAAPDGTLGGPFRPMDVFDLAWAEDPRISPDGERVVYVRRSFDVMTDRARSQLWIVRADGSDHRPLVTGPSDYTSPRWSPDGQRLAYVSTDEHDRRQLFVRWMDTGQEARVTGVPHAPSGLAWSPDGEWIAFGRFVEEDPDPIATMPEKPEGAEWADPPRVYEDVVYRSDGGGYLDPGHRQLFLVSSRGGTPRQLTHGAYDHEGTPSWTPDGRGLVFSANRRDDAELEPLDSEVWEVSLGGALRALTDRRGPDADPAVSPDGRLIAYTGFDDRYQGYQVTGLYVMERDGTGARRLAPDLDRDVGNPTWAADGRGLYVQYDDQGETRVAHVSLEGEVRDVARGVGGTSLGRPYASGSFTVSRTGRVAFTHGAPQRPAEVAVVDREGPPADDLVLTRLNGQLLGPTPLRPVEEIWYESSRDGRRIQGWIVKPPGFDPGRRYPMILEIHGGPFANYGPRFSAEVQLYAAAGYVVLYTNPRGSTSYGQEFGNLIHHAYPGDDYHDLMSGVDAVLERGYVDPDRLYVTGGSGGGVLSSWIVGTTDRFRAAAVQKPVINWTSWALTADMYPYGVKYWFPGMPWERPEHYWERSPLSLVGNVVTPTMLITGEEDYRTPIAESEQFYQALQLRGVPSALVRIPGASHGIAQRPSQLIAKVVHILGWFDRYGGLGEGRTAERATGR